MKELNLYSAKCHTKNPQDASPTGSLYKNDVCILVNRSTVRHYDVAPFPAKLQSTSGFVVSRKSPTLSSVSFDLFAIEVVDSRLKDSQRHTKHASVHLNILPYIIAAKM